MDRLSAAWATFRRQPPVLQVVAGALVAGLLATLAIGGGGGDDDGGGATTETTTAAQRDLARAESPLPPRCVEVPRELAGALESGLSKIDGGGKLRYVYAVVSRDREQVHFISGDVEGAELEGADDVATWAKSGPLTVGDGLIFSVDGNAKDWSGWDDGGSQDAGLSLEDDGARESRDCVEAAAEAAAGERS